PPPPWTPREWRTTRIDPFSPPSPSENARRRAARPAQRGAGGRASWGPAGRRTRGQCRSGGERHTIAAEALGVVERAISRLDQRGVAAIAVVGDAEAARDRHPRPAACEGE